MGMSVGLGVCFGAALGAVLGDVALWTAFGVCIGAGLGSVFGGFEAPPTRKTLDKPLPDPLGLFTRDDDPN